MNNSKWIWHHGDFELYHNVKLHIRRTEFGVPWPAFWRLDGCYCNVQFRKTVTFENEARFVLHARGVGFITGCNKRKQPFGKEIVLPAGTYKIGVYLFNDSGIPALFGEGDLITDETWECDHHIGKWSAVDCRDDFSELNSNPDIFPFSYEKLTPYKTELKNDGILYDYGKETFAKLIFTKINHNIKVYFGETEMEAMDTEHSSVCDEFTKDKTSSDACAFRYIFIPDAAESKVEFDVYYEFIQFKNVASFKCSDELINRIWDVSAYTLWLNSREFFLDGIKRDRWVWSGDAYQSYFVNRYLFFDEDIMRRTIIALRGKDPVECHINTIIDYSFYWIMSIMDYYEMTGDINFVKQMFPKMVSLMDYCFTKLNDDGFIDGGNYSSHNWVFIDWADFDKSGPLCAEQILMLRSLEIMADCCELVGENSEMYAEKVKTLRIKIFEYYWDEERGGLIDTYTSGNRNITRHANIFAIKFDYANQAQRESIIQNVLMNDNIPKINTPYFKFYELEAMCIIGLYKEVLEQIRYYWGAMLQTGSTSFWEKFDPEKPWQEQLKMYGQKYDMSLCHAWGATPVYILGRYFLGIKPTKPGYATYEVNPKTEFFDKLEAVIPVKNGNVIIKIENGVKELKKWKK